jgi:hypothetical protein
MTMPQVWIHETREPRVEFAQGFGKKLWKFGWGLAFVVLMTLLAEFGPRTVYSKMADAPVSISEQAVHAVK